MRWNRRGVARAAASAVFAVALAMGVMLPSVAMADEGVGTGTGTITVTAAEGNAGMVYDAYKIFTCDVDKASDGSGKYVATNISFSSAEMGKAVVGAISNYDNTFTGTSAQAVADYLESHITGGPDYKAEANGLIMNLAKAVDDKSVTDTLTAGEVKSLIEGYYMIIARPAEQDKSTLSSESSKVGTSPIFVMLGEGQVLELSEKTSLPTLTKTVAEGASATGTVAYADAQVGQDVTFTLTGTVSDNIVSFTSYAYTFEDTLPAGMELSCAGDSFAESDVTVNVVNGDTTTQIDASSYTAAYDSSTRKLTVGFSADGGTNDLLVAKDTSGAEVTIDASSKVTVSYRAKLTASATPGSAGNANTAKLAYSNNPQDPGTTGVSTVATATVYTYQLKLYKYGVDLNTKLPGAKFSIQATAADDEGSANQYVKTDGTFGGTTLPETSAANYSSYVFETDNEGLISVAGLDAGTYTISEIAAPDGYKTLAAPLVLTITPEFSNGAFTSMTATLSGGNGDENTKVTSNGGGVVTIQVTNALTEGKLPLTGLPGITLVYVLGGVILVVSLAVIVRRRLKNQK